MNRNNKKDILLAMIRKGAPMTFSQQARLVLSLATPAILAQLTTTMMQYIDASMVGSLGASASAAIGLVETTMWLMGSICSAAAAGFYVQVSHQLGGNDPARARATLRQGIMSVLVVSMLLGMTVLAISPFLPRWLGGGEDICSTSSVYIAIISLGLPAFQFSMFGYGMLRSSGNMVVPSVMSVVMMALDVFFNFFLIFPTRPMEVFGMQVMMPGAGLGVEGAAIGTVSAEAVAATVTMYILCFRKGELCLRQDSGRFLPTWNVVKNAMHIGLPMGLQQTIMTSAYIVTTIIIAPLGTIAIAANSFGIIVESLCYMPGYGVADAARGTDHRCRKARPDEAFRMALRRAWCSDNVGHGRGDVRGVAVCDGYDDSLCGGKTAWCGGAAHRSLRRTDVRCSHHLLRRVRGSRQDHSSEHHEPRFDVGRAHNSRRAARPDDGSAWRVAGDVPGALLPRHDIPREAVDMEAEAAEKDLKI